RAFGPFTEALITTGPPNFSRPVVKSSACRRCQRRSVPERSRSRVRARTYRVCVVGSITGVEVIPICGSMKGQKTLAEGTLVIPAAGLVNAVCQSGADVFAFASKA